MTKERRFKILAVALEILVPIALLGIWAAWSASSDTFYFPPLTDIFEKFQETWLFDRVGSDVLPSLQRLAIGYVIAVVVAVAVGIPLGLNPRPAHGHVADRGVPARDPAAGAAAVRDRRARRRQRGQDLPDRVRLRVAGAAEHDRRRDGDRPDDERDRARRTGSRGRDRLQRIILPAASPQIFAGMRTSLSLALILMVISEMVASTNGIGFFVLQSQRSFAIPEMWSGILLLGLLGYLLNVVFVLIERRVLAWHRGARASALS